MSAPSLVYDGKTFELTPGETILEGLLRHEIPITSSCRSGHCHACLVRGKPAPPEAQIGLKQTLIEQGFFLACQARPEECVELHATSGAETFQVTVRERTLIGDEILCLRLDVPKEFSYRSGQFLNVCHPSGAVRSYSIASHGAEDFLELHVRRIPGGLVSGWLHESVDVGTEIAFQGPHGSCFYVEGASDQPLILAGAGTGMAPLWGILRDALDRGHCGPIYVLQGALHVERLYLLQELRDVQSRASQVHLRLCALRGTGRGVSASPLDELSANVAREIVEPRGAGPRAFLCGDPGLVQKLRRSLFLAGVASAEIFADPFLPSAS